MRIAAIENGIVVGIVAESKIPTENVPVGRTFIDVTDHPSVQGGEHFDGGMFSPPNGTLDARLTKLEQAMVAVQTAVIPQKVATP